MHGAAFPVVRAVAPAEQLCHHPAHVRALRQRMTVSAVAADKQVAAIEVSAYARRHALLSDGRVQRAADPGAGVDLLPQNCETTYAGLFGREFEGTYPCHLAVQR